MADDVQDGRDLRRVAEGDLADQRPLQGAPVLHGGVAVQEVAVLLVWKTLGGGGEWATGHTGIAEREWDFCDNDACNIRETLGRPSFNG